MEKYYTRACNFYYGQNSVAKIKTKTALPLNGNKFISFESLGIINKSGSKIYNIKSIKKFDCKIIMQKNKGYGDALIQGIKSVNTNFFCIFNSIF